MNYNIQQVMNELFGTVRSLYIDNEPWFIGTDVANCLGYSNTRDALSNHVDIEDKNTVAIYDGIPGNPNKIIINESGLYSLIFGSHLPNAKQFKHWVTKEVLPTMRKIGFDRSMEVLNNELNQLREQNNMLLGQNQELGVKLMAKDSECVCTTAYVVYSTKLTPEMKREAMIFDPGEEFNYDKMREDMKHIEDGSNFYPTQLAPQINEETQEFLNNCGFKFVSFK